MLFVILLCLFLCLFLSLLSSIYDPILLSIMFKFGGQQAFAQIYYPVNSKHFKILQHLTPQIYCAIQYMISHKLSQIYKHYPCLILSLFSFVLYKSRYGQYNYLWYYIPFIIDPFTLKNLDVLFIKHDSY